MATIIDMQLMRYINLFSRISKVSTTKVFVYNNHIIFAVPKSKISIAIGKNAVNVKKLSEILRKKIKIVAFPSVDDNRGICKFVEDVVAPVEFNKLEIKNDTAVLSAGFESKAALIGRGRQREKELSGVLNNFFHIVKLRII